jgi:hypothetical protein
VGPALLAACLIHRPRLCGRPILHHSLKWQRYLTERPRATTHGCLMWLELEKLFIREYTKAVSVPWMH